MRYFTEPGEFVRPHYGEDRTFEHPLYSTGTLYERGGKGLVVVQQWFDIAGKTTHWGAIVPWMRDRLYLTKAFHGIFEELAKEADENGLYPTIPIRKLMWKMRMKPLRRERWETSFDRDIL